MVTGTKQTNEKLKVKRDKIQHPKAVFVITDGYGTPITCQYPERWHWFMTEGGSDSYIPKKSKKYDLKNYE